MFLYPCCLVTFCPIALLEVSKANIYVVEFPPFPFSIRFWCCNWDRLEQVRRLLVPKNLVSFSLVPSNLQMVQFNKEGVFDVESCYWAIQWCPDKAFVFGSCAQDGLLKVCDFDKVSNSLLSLSFLCPIQITGFEQILH